MTLYRPDQYREAIGEHMREWDEALAAARQALRTDIAGQLVAQGCEADVAQFMAEFYASRYERGCYNIVMYGHHHDGRDMANEAQELA